MKTIGTALEWFKTKPEAYIRHPKMQPGVCIRVTKYSRWGISSTYESNYGDGPPRLPSFRFGCPYLVKGVVNFQVYAVYGLVGGTNVIPTKEALEPVWYEVNPTECYEDSIE